MKNNLQDLSLYNGLTKERFNEICTDALRLTTFTKFLIGDIYNLAKDNKWTDSLEYQNLILKSGYSLRTIVYFGLTASRIPKNIRLEDVPFAHHEIVGKLNLEDRESTLLMIQDEGLSLTQLKKKLEPENTDYFWDDLRFRMIHRTVEDAKKFRDDFISEIEFFDGYTPTATKVLKKQIGFRLVYNPIAEMDWRFKLHMEQKFDILWRSDFWDEFSDLMWSTESETERDIILKKYSVRAVVERCQRISAYILEEEALEFIDRIENPEYWKMIDEME